MKKKKNGALGVIAMLSFGWFAIWVFRTVLSPVYPVIGAEMAVGSAAKLGLISSFYFLGYVAIQIPGGFLVDRFGRRRVLLPGFALFSAGAAVVAAAGSITAIYAGSVMAGLGSGVYYAAAFSLSAEKVPAESRALSTALVNSGSAVGMVVGYTASSLLVNSAGVNWRVPVAAAAVIGVAAAAALSSGLERVKPVAAEQRESFDLRSILSLPVITSAVFYFGTCYGYYMIVTWLPSFLESERGFAASTAGVLSSIVPLASIPGALFFGKLLDRFSKHRVPCLIAMQLGSALLLVAAATLRSPGLTVACFVVYGATGKIAEDPLIVLHVTDKLGGKRVATGLSIFNCLGMSASVFAPAVSGAMSDLTGSGSSGFYLAVGVLVVTALVFATGNLRRSS